MSHSLSALQPLSAPVPQPVALPHGFVPDDAKPTLAFVPDGTDTDMVARDSVVAEPNGPAQQDASNIQGAHPVTNEGEIPALATGTKMMGPETQASFAGTAAALASETGTGSFANGIKPVGEDPNLSATVASFDAILPGLEDNAADAAEKRSFAVGGAALAQAATEKNSSLPNAVIRSVTGHNGWEGGPIHYYVAVNDHATTVQAEFHAFGLAEFASRWQGWSFTNGVHWDASSHDLVIPAHVQSFDVNAWIKNDSSLEWNQTLTVQVGDRYGIADVVDDEEVMLYIKNATAVTKDAYGKTIIANKDALVKQEPQVKEYIYHEWGGLTSATIVQNIQADPNLERFIGMDLYNGGGFPGSTDVIERVAKLESQIDSYFNDQQILSVLMPLAPTPGMDPTAYVNSLASYANQLTTCVDLLAGDLQKIFAIQSSLLGVAPAAAPTDNSGTYTPIQFNLQLPNGQVLTDLTYKMPMDMLIQASNGGEAGGNAIYTYIDHTGKYVNANFSVGFYQSYAEYLVAVESNLNRAEGGISETIRALQAQEQQDMANKILSIVGAAVGLLGGGINNILGSSMSFASDLAGGKYHSGGTLNQKGYGDSYKLGGGFASMVGATTLVANGMANAAHGNGDHYAIDADIAINSQVPDPFGLFNNALISGPEKSAIEAAENGFTWAQKALVDRLEKLTIEAAYTLDCQGDHGAFQYHEMSRGYIYQGGQGDLYSDLRKGLANYDLVSAFDNEYAARGGNDEFLKGQFVLNPHVVGNHIEADVIAWYTNTPPGNPPFHGAYWDVIHCSTAF